GVHDRPRLLRIRHARLHGQWHACDEDDEPADRNRQRHLDPGERHDARERREEPQDREVRGGAELMSIETTDIQGSIVAPDGVGVNGGTVTFVLSSPCRAKDEADKTVIVAPKKTVTIGEDGSVSV